MKNSSRAWVMVMLAVSVAAVGYYAANLAGIVPSANFGAGCNKPLSTETTLGVCRLPPLRN